MYISGLRPEKRQRDVPGCTGVLRRYNALFRQGPGRVLPAPARTGLPGPVYWGKSRQ
jgi:hypothetical protein